MSTDNTLLYCTFYLEDSQYGIPIEHVQELGISGTIIPVPLAQPAVKGLMNLRGQIITLLDLRRLLDLPPQQACSDNRINVVVCFNGETFGLVADRTGEVLEIDTTKLESLPSNAKKHQLKLVSGIYTLTDSVLCILNLANIIQLASRPTYIL